MRRVRRLPRQLVGNDRHHHFDRQHHHVHHCGLRELQQLEHHRRVERKLEFEQFERELGQLRQHERFVGQRIG